MRMSLNLSGLLSRSGNTGVARPAASAEPDSTTEIERSAAGFIRVLGGKNEALRNRCEHVIGLTRVIEPLTNELSAVFLDFQKVVQELQATAGQLEETRAALDAQRQITESQSIEIQSLLTKQEEMRKDNERLLSDNIIAAQNYSLLEEQFRNTREQLGEKQAHLRSREFELENLRNENEVLTENLGRISDKLRDAERSISELQDDRRMLRDKAAQQGDEIASLTKSTEELSLQATNLKRQVLESSAAADRARSRIRLLETDQAALQSENETLRGSLVNNEARTEQMRASYEMKIEALGSRIRVSDQLLSQSRDEIRRLSDEQNTMQSRMRDLETLPGKVADAYDDATQAVRRAEDSEKAVALAQAKNAELFAKLQNAEELNKQAATRIESLQNTILRFEADAETRMGSMQARINQLAESLNKEQIERSFVEGALEAARRDRAQLQQSIVELKGNGNSQQPAEVGAQASNGETVKTTLERELDEIKSDLRRSHTDVPKLRPRKARAKDAE